MVVAEPEATLLTACENGYGKRTLFGPNSPLSGNESATGEASDDEAEPTASAAAPEPEESEEGEDSTSSANRYRTQRRGGKGLRDIKTTERNGQVIGVVCVRDDDEILMMTARGKLQRISAGEVSVIGRNTQGVRIMSLDEGDTLAAIVPVPRETETPA
jgi:DNA gyrase subunit A